MWLSTLARAALGAKHFYSFVFFVAMTWQVIRYSKEKQCQQSNKFRQ